MPTFELTPQLMREIIMDHYESPRHKGAPSSSEGYAKLHAGSVNCIDDYDMYLKVVDDKVSDAMWDGVACTISSASTDILCDLLIGKDKKESDFIIDQYLAMIQGKEFDESVLDEALVFINTGRQPARIHCATMGWDTMKQLLEEVGHGGH